MRSSVGDSFTVQKGDVRRRDAEKNVDWLILDRTAVRCLASTLAWRVRFVLYAEEQDFLQRKPETDPFRVVRAASLWLRHGGPDVVQKRFYPTCTDLSAHYSTGRGWGPRGEHGAPGSPPPRLALALLRHESTALSV